jgi:hypothetical protein
MERKPVSLTQLDRVAGESGSRIWEGRGHAGPAQSGISRASPNAALARSKALRSNGATIIQERIIYIGYT